MVKGCVDFLIGAGDFGGIGNTPVSFLGLAWKVWARLSSGLIANGNDEIKRMGGHCLPRFAVGLPGIDSIALEGRDRTRMYLSSRVAAGAGGVIAPLAKLVDEGFSHDGSAGVTRAEH